MPMLADQVDAVIGVDTHHDTHTASIVTPLGAELAHLGSQQYWPRKHRI